MDKLDWTKFSKRISVNAERKALYDAWSTEENLERWFLSEAQFFDLNKELKDRKTNIEKGDTYRWMWHGSDNIAEGEVLEVWNL